MSAPSIHVVSATRVEQGVFAQATLLGQSLRQPQHQGLLPVITPNNRDPLAVVYNAAIAAAPPESLLVFCHDDVDLGPHPLGPQLAAALQQFDLVGVAGNQRRQSGQMGWWLAGDSLQWDHEHLSGGILHGHPGAATQQIYGPVPRPVELLDGVFLAAQAGVLQRAGVQFDPHLAFHFYDLDVCRSARQLGLRLGTWPLPIVHASGGDPYSMAWLEALEHYQDKWKEPQRSAGVDQIVHYRHGQTLEQNGRWHQAESLYRNFPAKSPQHSALLLRLATVQHQQGQHEQAQRTVETVLANDPSLETAIALHQQGQLDQARQGYEAILAAEPDHPAAHHYLGLLEHQSGHSMAALEHLQQAVQSDAAEPFYWVNFGNLLKDLQRPQEAEDAYQRALAQDPADVLALYNLGHLYQLYGRWSDAAAAFGQAVHVRQDFVPAWHKLAAMELRTNRREQALAAAERAVALAPDDAPGWFHLADALGRFERWHNSKQALERCLALQPQFPEALNNLGLALKSLGDLAGAAVAFEAALQQAPPSDPANAPMAAETCANLAQLELDAHRLQTAAQWSERALAIDANNAKVLFSHGNVLNALGQYEPAASALRQALELQPDFPEALNNLGNILLSLRRHNESITVFERAVAQRPAYAEALANLANAQREASFPDLAEQALETAIRLKPDFAAAHSNLGNAYFDQGKVDLALASYRRGIELGQDDRDFVPNYLFALNYSPSAGDADLAAETRRLAAAKYDGLLGDGLADDGDGDVTQSDGLEPIGDRRLRIGYVSPDFWMHPVARFLLPVLEHHDRSQFEVFAYSSRYLKDGMTTETAQRVEHWREVHHLDDADLAEQIRSDGIDVLIDLTMYARDCRPGLFARKPAPIQITYLAYVGTTGLAAMDYRITDAILDPPDAPPLPFAEKPLRLPRCWWSFAVPPPVVTIPEVVPPPCLNSGVVSFGSLNNFVKVNEQVRELWAQLVASVPGSRLVLHIKETRARQGLLDFFAERGVSSDRISLIGYQNGPDYMATYGQIDIALDTSPFAGGTTSFDALWMGVPLVTLAGARSSSRGGASILTSLGRPEWIAHNPEQYIAIAQRLAADPQQLATIRSGLRAELQASPLMDGAGFTRELEALMLQAWDERSAST